MEFLEYLRSWKESTENRPGNFSQNARARMFLSWQTYEGFQLTVQSTIECTKFLLQEGMEYVLTERFCQDPAEEFFGKQRQLGRRSDNPDISQFGYNIATLLELRGQFHVKVETLEAGRTRRKHGCRLQMRSCRVEKSSNFNVTVACNCLVGVMYIYTCISLSEDKCNCMECCQNIQKLNNKEGCLRILT